MKVLILSSGSRGDVQPFVALARALESAGHEAILGVSSSSLELAARYGVRYFSINRERPRMVVDVEVGENAAPTGFSRRFSRKVNLLRYRRKTMSRAARDILDNLAESVYYGCDIVVYRPGMPAHQIAERIGIPAISAIPNACWAPTSSFPDPRFPIKVPRALNRVTFWWSNRNIRKTLDWRAIREWRRGSLGLPIRRRYRDDLRQSDGIHVTFLQAFSELILPSVNYAKWVNTTGFWHLPSPPDWMPPKELMNFIASGESPVYIGFGSMVGTNPERITRLVIEAVRLAGVRAVVSAGWGGIQVDDLSLEDIFPLHDIPHDWLFPKVAAVVHHGGAGTTAAALTASRPQVICPFHMDQPFNGWRMHSIGVATKPQSFRGITAEGLAHAIRKAVTEHAMAKKAGEIGSRVGSECGVAMAVKIIESKAASY